jgi:hypothetical protein
VIQVKARSGHILHVADEAAADYWVSLGYERVEDGASAEDGDKKPAPRRRAAAKKSTSKS